MNRKSNLIGLGIIAVIIIVGVLAYLSSQGDTPPVAVVSPTLEPPTVEIGGVILTPPVSLAELSAELEDQYPELAELLNNPELSSVYKDFYITYQNFGQEAALAMAQERGILNEAGDITMVLVLDTSEPPPELVESLENEGVIVESAYQDRINLVIPIDLILEQIEAESPELILERISGLDHVIALRFPEKMLINQGGGTVSQGVTVTLADRWQQQGIAGAGVKVGVLDLGFAGYEKLLGTELPAQVTMQTFGNPANLNTEVHGAACAEIVHEMAPNAEIILTYFDGTEAAMGQAVDWLLGQGVDIISNSTSISGLTPMDGTGFLAELVNRARAGGVFWVNAAGNRAEEHYRGQFTDGNGDTLHEFAPDITGLPFTVKAGTSSYLILSWNDWGSANQDYDLVLYDKNGSVLAKAEDLQSGQPGQRPLELISYHFATADTYLLSVQNRDGQARGDATFDIFVYYGEIPTQFRVGASSLGTPADAHGAFTVGAVNWSNDVLEPYSSQGPTSDGRIKPELVAPSAVKNASYAPSIFDGTSAAAPHVAGAAALTLQAFPDFSPDDIMNFLESRAIELGSAGPDNQFGAGRLNLGDAP